MRKCNNKVGDTHKKHHRQKSISGLIRITSGEFRGRVIKAPGGAVHPMGARERLSLLNSVAPFLEDAIVLDAYAGTGALGLESISRRAAHVTFIENSPAVAKTLKENIRMLGVERFCKVIISPVEDITGKLDAKFNIIFADPPYSQYQPEVIVPLEQFLRPGGLLALSHPKGSPIPQFCNLILKSFHLHAGCRISIFCHESSKF